MPPLLVPPMPDSLTSLQEMRMSWPMLLLMLALFQLPSMPATLHSNSTTAASTTKRNAVQETWIMVSPLLVMEAMLKATFTLSRTVGPMFGEIKATSWCLATNKTSAVSLHQQAIQLFKHIYLNRTLAFFITFIFHNFFWWKISLNKINLI